MMTVTIRFMPIRTIKFFRKFMCVRARLKTIVIVFSFSIFYIV